MGATQNNGAGAKSKQATKGYTGTIAGSWNTKGGTAYEHYGNCDPATLTRAVRLCASAGGALLFGCTRDGGALAVTLFYQETKVRFYPTSAEQLELLLEDISAWSANDTRRLEDWAGH